MKTIKVYVVLHRYCGSIIDSEIFETKNEAEQYIRDEFEYNPGLDYKDSFYLREIIIEEPE